MTKPIPYTNLTITAKEKQYLEEAISSGQLAGKGEFTLKCENWLQNFSQTPFARLVTSCTSALEMSAILAGVQQGDEVIMPSFTFVSTANAFVLFGVTPVFVDIRPDTLNIDEKLIEDAITEKTKAIVPVHYAGVGCEMDVILDIAKRHNLLVIEDAAQGLGSKYKGKDLGTFGQMGAISFHQTKNISSGGEGGAIFVNEPSLIERAEIILEKGTNRKQFFQGIVDKYTWVDVGSSFVLSDLLAAFLLAQLERLEEINLERKNQWSMYHNAFSSLEQAGNLTRPTIPDETTHNGHIYYLLMNTEDERNAFISHMKSQNIGAVFHYIPLHSSPQGQKISRVGSSMSYTDDLSGRLIRLPLWAGLGNDNIEHIIDSVYSFFNK